MAETADHMSDSYEDRVWRDGPEPIGRPMYDLMQDLGAFMTLYSEVGGEELQERLRAEVRQAMEEQPRGVRVVLWYHERIQDINSRMGEWTA